MYSLLNNYSAVPWSICTCMIIAVYVLHNDAMMWNDLMSCDYIQMQTSVLRVLCSKGSKLYYSGFAVNSSVCRGDVDCNSSGFRIAIVNMQTIETFSEYIQMSNIKLN